MLSWFAYFSAILGLIPRKCPNEPLAELFWEIQTCSSDHDCWPRICCPDGRKKYCRTSKPELDSLPVGRQLAYRMVSIFNSHLASIYRHLFSFAAIESISSYLQCTPAPPSTFDIFPKLCNNTLDCFPNVCCQELGKKHCRPPKRSLLAFVTGFAQVSSSCKKSVFLISSSQIIYNNLTQFHSISFAAIQSWCY